MRSRRAFETGLYDDCDSDAVIAFLENRPDHYDLIMAADPAIVQADAAAFFSAVKIALALAGVFIGVFSGTAEALGQAAKAEGLFLLATETLPDGSICLIAES